MYKVVLIIIGMLVLYGIFAFQNPFNNAKVTAVRGLVAILVGWVMVMLITLLINNNNIELSAVSIASELTALEEKNNSRMMGALFFGWAFPLIFIELLWGAVYLVRYAKNKNSLNHKLLKS